MNHSSIIWLFLRRRESLKFAFAVAFGPLPSNERSSCSVARPTSSSGDSARLFELYFSVVSSSFLVLFLVQLFFLLLYSFQCGCLICSSFSGPMLSSDLFKNCFFSFPFNELACFKLEVAEDHEHAKKSESGRRTLLCVFCYFFEEKLGIARLKRVVCTCTFMKMPHLE